MVKVSVWSWLLLFQPFKKRPFSTIIQCFCMHKLDSMKYDVLLLVWLEFVVMSLIVIIISLCCGSLGCQCESAVVANTTTARHYKLARQGTPPQNALNSCRHQLLDVTALIRSHAVSKMFYKGESIF